MLQPIKPSHLTKNLELQDFGRLLVIAKGIDFDALDHTKQIELSNQILELFLDFIDQSLTNSSNQDVAQQWQIYKDSQFDSSILSLYPEMSKAMSQLANIFIQIK
jgi:hypothetical protein